MSAQLCDPRECTGCTACVNACPCEAIRMRPDDDGFLYPEADAARCRSCGLCTRSCPVLNPRDRDADPSCFAARSNDADLVRESSSGGVFSELAMRVLDAGGSVFGAAYVGDGLTVEHREVRERAELGRLRGSKYVQSDLSDVFRQVRTRLAEGRQVFFSGTPCQVAGLKAFLGKDEEKLLTVEVICHGVPSASLFERLKSSLEQAHGRLVRLSFRDKAEGWGSRAVTGWYESGRKIREKGPLNAYLNAFLGRLTLRHSCGTCPFTDGRSGADLTLGDFWGVGRAVPALDDDKGASAVIIHSKKGADAFAAIACEKHEVPLTAITAANPSYRAPRSPNPGRDAFLRLAGSVGTECAYARCAPRPSSLRRLLGFGGRPGGRRVAVSTLDERFLLSNYGTFFQHYALREVLKGLGLAPMRLITRSEYRSPWWLAKKRMADAMRRVYWMLARRDDRRMLVEDLARENRRLRGFLSDYRTLVGRLREDQDLSDVTLGVLGGDQILGSTDPRDWLAELPADAARVTYAASADWERVRGDVEWRRIASERLPGFARIGLRETAGVEFCRELLGDGRGVERVVDPVMLLEWEDYARIAREATGFGRPTLFCYFVNIRTREDLDIAAYEALAERLKCELKIVAIQGAHGVVPAKYALAPSPREFLRAIADAAYFVTNSYHGTAFALLARKAFVTVRQHDRPEENQNLRLDELMGEYGLEARRVATAASVDALASVLETAVDWPRVERLLRERRRESLQWLEEEVEILI